MNELQNISFEDFLNFEKSQNMVKSDYNKQRYFSIIMCFISFIAFQSFISMYSINFFVLLLACIEPICLILLILYMRNIEKTNADFKMLILSRNSLPIRKNDILNLSKSELESFQNYIKQTTKMMFICTIVQILNWIVFLISFSLIVFLYVLT